jgi:PHD/YefM family antitoxin component YafN of YafNO toxin-antitoxin module
MPYRVKEEQVLYNARGKKTHVLIPFKRYEKLMEYLEDLEDLQAMKEVANEPDIPWEEVKRKLSKKKR